MKKPSKHQYTPTAKPSQQSMPPTPPTIRELTDADLEYVQGGREPTRHPTGGSVPPVQ